MTSFKNFKEQELKDKIEANLAKSRELESQDTEPVEFELRKNPLPKQAYLSPSQAPKSHSPDRSVSPGSQATAMPRAVLLSNVHLQHQLKSVITPKLYDDDDINAHANSQPSSQDQNETNDQSKDSSIGKTETDKSSTHNDDCSDDAKENSKNESDNSVNTNESLSNEEQNSSN